MAEDVAATTETTETPEAPRPGAYASFKSGEYEMESNRQSSDEIRDSLAVEPPNPDAPEPDPEAEKAEKTKAAASELGKRSAEKRAEKPKDEPAESEAKPAQKAPESDKDDEPAEKAAKPEADDEKDDKGNPRKKSQPRFLQATREAAELRRQLAERDAELAKLKNGRSGTQPAAKNDPEPDPSQYQETAEDTQRYIRDLSAWTARQALQQDRETTEKQSQEQEKAEQTRKVQETLNTRASEFREKIQEAKSADPEFEGRVREFTDLLSPTWIQNPKGEWVPQSDIGPLNLLADEIFIRSDDPVKLIEHFVAHPQDVESLANAKNGREFDRLFGKIEDRLEAAPAKPPVRSTAKPPVKPTPGSAEISGDVDLSDDLDEDTWMERRIRLARKTGR